MPHSDQQFAVRARVRPLAQPPAASLPIGPRGDVASVTAEIARIMSLAEAGLIREAREAAADLMFDFQPLLMARPELLQRFELALRRCKAGQLRRRLAMALRGDTA